MRYRNLGVFAILVALSVLAAMTAGPQRLPWIVTCALSFVGIFVFDSQNQIAKNTVNSGLFIFIFGLTLLALLEPTPEYVCRDAAGSILLLALGHEQTSEKHSVHRH